MHNKVLWRVHNKPILFCFTMWKLNLRSELDYKPVGEEEEEEEEVTSVTDSSYDDAAALRTPWTNEKRQQQHSSYRTIIVLFFLILLTNCSTAFVLYLLFHHQPPPPPPPRPTATGECVGNVEPASTYYRTPPLPFFCHHNLTNSIFLFFFSPQSSSLDVRSRPQSAHEGILSLERDSNAICSGYGRCGTRRG